MTKPKSFVWSEPFSVSHFGSNIKSLIDLRKRFPYNPLTGYNNINVLKEKVIPLSYY